MPTEPIYADEIWGFSSDGRLLCRSLRGDRAWDTPENRHFTFLWILKAQEALREHGVEIPPLASEGSASPEVS